MRKYDLFPKVADESFDVRTETGGIITVVTFVFMSVIFVLAFRHRETEATEQHAVLRTGSASASMDIFMDVTVAYPCQLLRVTVQDATGNHPLESERMIKRQRLDGRLGPLSPFVLDTDGGSVFSSCGSCYDAGAADACCLTCFDVAAHFTRANRLVPNLDGIAQCQRDRQAIEIGECCRVVAEIGTTFSCGEILINAGGSAQMPVHYKHDLTYFGDSVNLSHWFAALRFGPAFPGQVNPLDGARWKQRARGFFNYHYQTHLVPTIALGKDGGSVDGNQYAASFSEREIDKTVSKRHPGIAIGFQTSPVAVKVWKRHHAAVQGLTRALAVMGGGFMVGGLVDSCLFWLSERGRRRRVQWRE